MKIITLSLAALLCSSSSLISDEGAAPNIAMEQMATQERLGKEAIHQVREAYERGEYDGFLQELEASYQEVLDQKQLTALSDLRAGLTADPKFIDAANQLQKEKNKALLK